MNWNMYSAEKTLDHILCEFPEYTPEITELYHESSNFIEICEDYLLCLESIHSIESKKEPGYEHRLIPLNEALNDLKEELISKLVR